MGLEWKIQGEAKDSVDIWRRRRGMDGSYEKVVAHLVAQTRREVDGHFQVVALPVRLKQNAELLGIGKK